MSARMRPSPSRLEFAAPPPPLRARLTPPVSILLASATALAPVVASAPTMPPLGLLTALAWRLLRPEFWRSWMALPLGLFDDLCTGQPLGLAAAIWTTIFLALETIDYRLMIREVWLDWAIAAIAILFALIAGAWGVGAEHGGFALLVPQLLVSILCVPVVLRTVLALDRWRLAP